MLPGGSPTRTVSPTTATSWATFLTACPSKRARPTTPSGERQPRRAMSSPVTATTAVPTPPTRKAASRSNLPLELARIGSLLFIFADSPNDQNGSSSSIDTFATRLSAQPLSDGPNKATGNRILSNSIYDNARLGIDLYHTNDDAGVTCNDLAPPPDNDTGPNNLQNFPEITSAKLTTKRIGGHRRKVTIIKGTLNSNANTTFTLQFFGSPEANPPSGPLPCGPASFGEGKRLLGQKSVIANSSGDATFTFSTRKKIPKGQVVTATATNQTTRDTSEFSKAVAVS